MIDFSMKCNKPMKAPQLIQLPKFLDDRGNLSFFENDNQIPFTIRRVHWIYDVPGGVQRGAHAYRENQELVVALSGSFDVVIDDGKEQKSFHLNRSYYGLYLPKYTWRVMENFSTNSLALVLSSTDYDTDDYIFDYEQFKREVMQ